jgi:hypothetical protein
MDVKLEIIEISKIELKPGEFLIARCPEDWGPEQVLELADEFADVARYWREDRDPRHEVLERIVVLPYVQLDEVQAK